MNKKQCTICSRMFSRKLHTSNEHWGSQKTCSIECRSERLKAKDKQCLGRALRYGKRHYECGQCSMLIIGNKSDLINHKYEVHSH